MTSATPIAGQIAVVKSLYSWDLVRVESATTKQFKGSVRESYVRTIPFSQCVFCGDEASARQLYDRLISSEAQCRDEKRKAEERYEKRDAELIAAALGASS